MFSSETKRITNQGYARMKNSRVVICGCIRDGASSVKMMASWAVRLGDFFRDYRIIFFESDSMDNTSEIVEDLSSRNPKIIALTERADNPRRSDHSVDRMKVMAYCRNKYLDLVKEKFADYDYMIVVDWDLRKWKIDGIANSIGHDDWDMIGGNGKIDGKYYDLFPLRIKSFDDKTYRPIDLGHAISYECEDLLSYKIPRLNPGHDLFPVKSCFCGLGIYKIGSIGHSRYGSEDCEHVSFHKKIHENSHVRFFVNPSMVFDKPWIVECLDRPFFIKLVDTLDIKFKTHLPSLYFRLRNLKEILLGQREFTGFKDLFLRRDAFGEIYRNNIWGFGSGFGSTVEATKEYVTILNSVLEQFDIEKVLDVGCGDWQFSKTIDWSGVDYTGVDTVQSVIDSNKRKYSKNNIHFSHLNATDSDLPGADLLIIKDVLQHLPNKDIRKILAKTKTFRYVLITNDYTLNNSDCAIGDYRGLNLLVKPFVLDSEIVFTKKLNFDRGIVKEVILMKNEDLV